MVGLKLIINEHSHVLKRLTTHYSQTAIFIFLLFNDTIDDDIQAYYSTITTWYTHLINVPITSMKDTERATHLLVYQSMSYAGCLVNQAFSSGWRFNIDKSL